MQEYICISEAELQQLGEVAATAANEKGTIAL